MDEADVTIVDYGLGNILSVCRGLEYHGASVAISSDPSTIATAKRLVLPGVGAFSAAMELLRSKSLADPVCAAAARNIPLLGVCVGMQLLFDESNEFGQTTGLGLIRGVVRPIPRLSVAGERLKSPNIGWRPLMPTSDSKAWNDTILETTKPGEAAYFLHSFAAVCNSECNKLAISSYGGHEIVSVVSQGRIVGCQFHPEKSGAVGLKILGRFLQS